MSEKIKPTSLTSKEFHEAVAATKEESSKLTAKLGKFVGKFLVTKMNTIDTHKALSETKPYEFDYDPFAYGGHDNEKAPLGYHSSYDEPNMFGNFYSTDIDELSGGADFSHTPLPLAADMHSYDAPVQPATDLIGEQIANELSYNINIQPAPADAELTPAEIIELMEVDHAVKQAPRFSDQVKDASRTNRITYISDELSGIKTSTSSKDYERRRKDLTEHEVLVQTEKFFSDSAALGEHLDDYTMKRFSQSVLDNLTFIGEKEYKEAANGIATYWKALLERNPDQQILVLAGEIAKQYGEGSQDGSGKPSIKSDEYLLDTILANFTDEEVEKYKGRLVMDMDDVEVKSPNDLKVIFLDDWTISGSQLNGVVRSFKSNYPQYASCPEIQLIVSNDTRATRGLAAKSYSSPATKLSTPVRSYYRAHHTLFAENLAHITGSHSSVDYDFENDTETMLDSINDYHRGQYIPDLDDPNSAPYETVMPPMTNIVRPYRSNGYKLTQKDRFSTKAPSKKRG